MEQIAPASDPVAADQGREAAPIELPRCCAICFRPGHHPHSALSRLDDLKRHEVVMVQTGHGLEPALVHQTQQLCGPAAADPELAATPQPATPPTPSPKSDPESGGSADHNREQRRSNNKSQGNGDNGDDNEPLPLVIRRANREEQEKFISLQHREQEAFSTCQELIARHRLPMKLIRVERFFNGGKIIFYFTAENRVDFRELVKDLVQEFRTRVEIRQVGVRHETKMIGGIGCCGRELCCSSYIRNFQPVSIKMAKEQGLPLNPAKISGICNRLLCCLTYEFETYRQLRRRMPKPGKQVSLDGHTFKVTKVNTLEETVEVISSDEPDRTIIWQSSEWSRCQPAAGPGKGGGGGRAEGSRTAGRPSGKPGGKPGDHRPGDRPEGKPGKQESKT